MIGKSIAKVQTIDRNVNQLQSYITTLINQITNAQILNGNLLPAQQNGQVIPFTLYGSTVTSLSLKNSKNPTEISHYLGRNLVGWIVIGNNTNCTVWDSQASNTVANGHSGADKTLLLNVSADTTLNLYVF